MEGDTGIFIYPGYRWKVVDGMVTNFHLPQSTLIMLVSAFLGRERTLFAYREAVKERYRFFSYGEDVYKRQPEWSGTALPVGLEASPRRLTKA